jgi:hypothetical protein
MKFQVRSLILVGGLSLSFALAPNSRAQVAKTQTPGPVASYKSVPSGAKMKFQGVVIERNADTFTIRDRTRTDYQVRITDDTSVKTYGGFLKGGKKYPVTDLMRGLIVEVEGEGDA